MTDQGQDQDKRVKAWLCIYAWLICYRFRDCLNSKLKLPSYLTGTSGCPGPESITRESIQEKAKASLATVGVIFGFGIAVLAAMLGSKEFRESMNGALHRYRLGAMVGFVFIGVALPYLTIWLERFISSASVEWACKENECQETVKEKRKHRFILLCLALALSLIFFIGVPSFWSSQNEILYFAFPLSGLVLIVLSTFLLLLSLNFYDSATGWRSGEEVEWRFHLASIASHSYVLGVALTLVGVSLLLCFLSFWFGRIITCASLVVILVMIKIERNLWDLRPEKKSP